MYVYAYVTRGGGIMTVLLRNTTIKRIHIGGVVVQQELLSDISLWLLLLVQFSLLLLKHYIYFCVNALQFKCNKADTWEQESSISTLD